MTDAQRLYRDQTRAAQIGIPLAQYQDRLAAMRTPAYNAAMFGGRGMSVAPSTLAHWQAGGTTAGLLGDRYEFLDRGGLGAPATGMQHGVTPRAGFAAVAPGLQPPPTTPTPAGPPAAATTPPPTGLAAVRPAARRGLGTRFGARA